MIDFEWEDEDIPEDLGKIHILRENGDILKFGKSHTLHEDDDNSVKYGYINGDGEKILHRTDGPARISGYDEHWFFEGGLHREDGPAFSCKDGNFAWWFNDLCHNASGPALILKSDSKCWYVNDMYHREDGPAVEWEFGEKEWYVCGVRHRKNGPAIERPNGNNEYWEYGVKIRSTEI